MIPRAATLTRRLSPGARLGLVVLLTLAAAIHLLNTGYADWSAGADTFYVMVLLILFFAPERIDDERVQELKLRSLTVAFAFGWATAGALRFASYLQDRDAVPRTISAYDAMFVVLLAANALFHFWRYADGRSQPDHD
jgi:hypothetical protein